MLFRKKTFSQRKAIAINRTGRKIEGARIQSKSAEFLKKHASKISGAAAIAVAASSKAGPIKTSIATFGGFLLVTKLLELKADKMASANSKKLYSMILKRPLIAAKAIEQMPEGQFKKFLSEIVGLRFLSKENNSPGQRERVRFFSAKEMQDAMKALETAKKTAEMENAVQKLVLMIEEKNKISSLMKRDSSLVTSTFSAVSGAIELDQIVRDVTTSLIETALQEGSAEAEMTKITKGKKENIGLQLFRRDGKWVARVTRPIVQQ